MLLCEPIEPLPLFQKKRPSPSSLPSPLSPNCILYYHIAAPGTGPRLSSTAYSSLHITATLIPHALLHGFALALVLVLVSPPPTLIITPRHDTSRSRQPRPRAAASQPLQRSSGSGESCTSTTLSSCSPRAIFVARLIRPMRLLRLRSRRPGQSATGAHNAMHKAVKDMSSSQLSTPDVLLATHLLGA